MATDTVINPKYKCNDLTAEYIRSILHYDPETGFFIWKINASTRAKIGCRAGRISRFGYRQIGFNKNLYMAHKMAWLYMTGNWPDTDLDHINRSRDDNRFSNLRPVTRSQNMWNRTLNKNNKSGHRGVCWHKSSNKWEAQIKIGGNIIKLGYFHDKLEAILAYDRAAKEYHGEYGGHKI